MPNMLRFMGIDPRKSAICAFFIQAQKYIFILIYRNRLTDYFSTSFLAYNQNLKPSIVFNNFVNKCFFGLFLAMTIEEKFYPR